MMKQDPQFEKIRDEIEAKQRAILWPDTLKAGGSVDGLLWKGDPKAKPIQRAGMIVFAMFFWFMGCCIAAIWWVRGEYDFFGRFLGVLLGSMCVLLSIRLFRNAFLHQNKTGKTDMGSEK